jgi:hypothetical protein
MTSDDPVLKAFSDFGIDDVLAEGAGARRMLRRIKGIDPVTTPGPTTSAARAALGTEKPTDASRMISFCSLSCSRPPLARVG